MLSFMDRFLVVFRALLWSSNAFRFKEVIKSKQDLDLGPRENGISFSYLQAAGERKQVAWGP